MINNVNTAQKYSYLQPLCWEKSDTSVFEMWDEKSAERAPPPQRIPGHGVGYLLSPAHWWKARTRAPSPGVLGTSTPSGRCRNQASCKTKTSHILELSFIKSQGGINENYWAHKGAGYCKKPTQPPSAAVGGSKAVGDWESDEHNKWLSNPNSHLQSKSLKNICIQRCTRKRSKSRTEDPYITVQGSPQTRQVLQAAVRLWQLRHVRDMLQSML